MKLAAKFLAFTLLASAEVASAQPKAVEYLPAQLGQWCPLGRNSWRRIQVISEVERAWYPKHWAAAGEPSLFAQSKAPAAKQRTTYRFTWLRSFDAPIIVRVDEVAQGKLRVTSIELSGRGGQAPGKVKRRTLRVLSSREAAQIMSALRSVAPASIPGASCDPPGLDGARWIIEANDKGKYTFVARQSPKDGPVRVLGLSFLKLTGWSFGDDVY